MGEHVRVLQELSTLYRTLCFWESDVKRALAMMARRAQMLAPLLDQLNQKVYIAFWRQLSFEVGEIYQEMYDLRALGKTGACGTLEKVEEHEAHAFLIAHLNRARLRTKMLGLSIDDQVEAHKLALREYTWIQDYGRRNPEVHTKPSIGLAQELKLCDEMVGCCPPSCHAWLRSAGDPSRDFHRSLRSRLPPGRARSESGSDVCERKTKLEWDQKKKKKKKGKGKKKKKKKKKKK